VSERNKTLLIVCQVYPPDPAAVGQYMGDAACEMVRRGWRVVVMTSARGYDDPSMVYRQRESVGGVDIVRLPLSSFGKSSIAIRLLAQSIFLAQVLVRGLLMQRLDCVLVSTSPPMASLVGWVFAVLMRVPVKYWVMDLNPDQMVELGRLGPRSIPVRAFDALNRLILRVAQDVIVLDHFMAERVNRKVDVRSKLSVVPPWPLESHLRVPPAGENAFVSRYELQGKFVVMYSGNHSPANPLDTVLGAASRLEHDERFVFLFIGGGQGKRDVEGAIAAGARNIRSLPYQPLDQLGESLSAATVHVVSIGDAMVGVVHPCKIYGVMAVGRPVLTLGPRKSHLSELVERFKIGRQVEHGDVDGAVAALLDLANEPGEELAALGRRASEAIRSVFSREQLCGRFCDTVEARQGGAAAPPAPADR
jgi:colanic acid biosynthesis glycosyl transferase WcaI